ncbi:MAG: ATP-dependent Clp protease ATP-binding subunit ClpA, partial [Legionellales bacterium]|jgi:ATP-dependent Clp protease ATP-binding subunit ClpA
VIYQVVDKFLVELQAQLDDKSVTLEVDESARTYLVEKGYDPKMGARPMARLIQTEIKMPLAEEILFGQLNHGGYIKISFASGKLAFAYTKAEVFADAD